jgi:hypothetical protein
MMRNALFVAFVFLLMQSMACRPKAKSYYTKNDIQGSWYLNKWEPFNSLAFGDSTVFVGNSTDTVFNLNYRLSHDSLITWAIPTGQKYSRKILLIDKDNLVLEGIHDNTETLKYSHKKTDYK